MGEIERQEQEENNMDNVVTNKVKNLQLNTTETKSKKGSAWLFPQVSWCVMHKVKLYNRLIHDC